MLTNVSWPAPPPSAANRRFSPHVHVLPCPQHTRHAGHIPVGREGVTSKTKPGLGFRGGGRAAADLRRDAVRVDVEAQPVTPRGGPRRGGGRGGLDWGGGGWRNPQAVTNGVGVSRSPEFNATLESPAKLRTKLSPSLRDHAQPLPKHDFEEITEAWDRDLQIK